MYHVLNIYEYYIPWFINKLIYSISVLFIAVIESTAVHESSM